jgi:hypothetical protein
MTRQHHPTQRVSWLRARNHRFKGWASQAEQIANRRFPPYSVDLRACREGPQWGNCGRSRPAPTGARRGSAACRRRTTAIGCTAAVADRHHRGDTDPPLGRYAHDGEARRAAIFAAPQSNRGSGPKWRLCRLCEFYRQGRRKRQRHAFMEAKATSRARCEAGQSDELGY